MVFVCRQDVPKLKRFFRRERNVVALLWVQQTVSVVRRILQHHLEASRMSQSLEFTLEVRIFLQYAQLRVICGILFLLIRLAGPERLRGISLYTMRLTQNIEDILRDVETGTRTHEMNGVGPS